MWQRDFFERWSNVKKRKSGRFGLSTRRPVMSMEGGQDLEPLSENENIRYKNTMKLLLPLM